MKNVSRWERDGCAGRESELVEVVVDGLDLAIVDDLVAEPEEGVLDDPAGERRRMQRPEATLLAGQGDIHAVLGQLAVELGALELLLAAVDRRLEPLAQRVQRHPRLAIAHLAKRELEGALASQVLDPDPLDLVCRTGRGDRRQCLRLQLLHVHRVSEVSNGLRPA